MATKPKPKPPAGASWAPVSYEPQDMHAVQALRRGDATPDQQKRALAWIIESAAGTYDLSYRPDSDRDTAFAEGRRFVGLQLVKLLNLRPATAKDSEHG